MKTLKERFDEKWTLDLQTGCWVWTGAVASHGYGAIGDEQAHRVSYRLYVGDIPDDALVTHGPCHNNLCVNPEHLSLGTRSSNQLDRRRDGTAISRRKLTAADVVEIRRLYANGGVSYQTLASKYGVSDGAVCDAVNRITWKHI